jgi:hypothetical protein
MEFTLKANLEENIKNTVENGARTEDVIIGSTDNKVLTDIMSNSLLFINNDVLNIIFGYIDNEFIIKYIIYEYYGNVYFEFSITDQHILCNDYNFNFTICCSIWTNEIKKIDSIY